MLGLEVGLKEGVELWRWLEDVVTLTLYIFETIIIIPLGPHVLHSQPLLRHISALHKIIIPVFASIHTLGKSIIFQALHGLDLKTLTPSARASLDASAHLGEARGPHRHVTILSPHGPARRHIRVPHWIEKVGAQKNLWIRGISQISLLVIKGSVPGGVGSSLHLRDWAIRDLPILPAHKSRVRRLIALSNHFL